MTTLVNVLGPAKLSIGSDLLGSFLAETNTICMHVISFWQSCRSFSSHEHPCLLGTLAPLDLDVSSDWMGLGCRGSRDIIQQAVKLSMEHMDLFSDRAAHPPDSKGARAVSALDSLVQELAAPEQVYNLIPDLAFVCRSLLPLSRYTV